MVDDRLDSGAALDVNRVRNVIFVFALAIVVLTAQFQGIINSGNDVATISSQSPEADEHKQGSEPAQAEAPVISRGSFVETGSWASLTNLNGVSTDQSS